MNDEVAAPAASVEDRLAALYGSPEAPATTREPETAQPEVAAEADETVETTDEVAEGTDQSAEGTTDETENLADVEIDGEVLKVHPKVKDAVMRHKDYTQKTMALADERKVFQAERQTAALQEAFQKEIAPDSTALSKLEAQIDQFKQLNWAEMDTDQIVRARQALDGIKEQRDELKATIDGKRQEFLTNYSRSREQLLNQGAEYLKKTIPAWGESAQRESAQAALGVGFTKEEVSNFMDPRAVQLAWKAAQWDKLQSSKPSVTQKVKTAPPVSKPGSAATTESTTSKVYADARNRLKKSGSQQDAIAALLARTR